MADPSFSHARFQEAHDLIVCAWTEIGPFAFDGKHYRYSYVNFWPRPYQPPHPPIWIPSQGSRETYEWAAHPERRYTYLITFNPAEALKRNLDAYVRQAGEYGYRAEPGQLGWVLPVYVAETDRIAAREAAPHIEAFFNKFVRLPAEYKLPPGYSSMTSCRYVMETKFKVREQFLSYEILTGNGMFVCSSPQIVRDLLARRFDEMGYGNLVTMLQFGALPRELTEKNLRLFAGEVMPALRPLGEPVLADVITAAE